MEIMKSQRMPMSIVQGLRQSLLGSLMLVKVAQISKYVPLLQKGPILDSLGGTTSEGWPYKRVINKTMSDHLLKSILAKTHSIAERMVIVKHKILVLSGKGGVGKSTSSAQLSFALASKDYQVGLLDIDICGASIPKMPGLEGQDIHKSTLGWSPIYLDSNLGVISLGFMLPDPDEAIIWRGPHKNILIKKIMNNVHWGEIDYLVVDTPLGTSDEHISIVQFLQASGIDGAVIVTTPQQVSLIDVRKGISFCKKVGIRVVGVMENMSGMRQPLLDFKFQRLVAGEKGTTVEDVTEWAHMLIKENAPELLSIFACCEVFDSSRGSVAKMCADMDVPFLGKVSMDPQLGRAAEEGRSCFEDQKCSSISTPALLRIVEQLIAAHE